MTARLVGRLAVPVVLALALTGCFRLKQQGAQNTGPTPANSKVNVLGPFPGAKRVIDEVELKQLGIYYINAATINNRPPASVDELGIKQEAPKLYQAIADQSIIVLWKTNPMNAPAGTSNTILAYDADVPTKGGAVLMLDGTPRKMTADEFKNAAKTGQ
jgi:hypothetical protein